MMVTLLMSVQCISTI